MDGDKELIEKMFREHDGQRWEELEMEYAALKREVAMWRSEHDPCPFSLENETLRAENERLDKQVARFLEPVSDEEVKKHFWKQDPTTWGIRITYAEGVNALIADRLEPKG